MAERVHSVPCSGRYSLSQRNLCNGTYPTNTLRSWFVLPVPSGQIHLTPAYVTGNLPAEPLPRFSRSCIRSCRSHLTPGGSEGRTPPNIDPQGRFIRPEERFRHGRNRSLTSFAEIAAAISAKGTQRACFISLRPFVLRCQYIPTSGCSKGRTPFEFQSSPATCAAEAYGIFPQRSEEKSLPSVRRAASKARARRRTPPLRNIVAQRSA